MSDASDGVQLRFELMAGYMDEWTATTQAYTQCVHALRKACFCQVIFLIVLLWSAPSLSHGLCRFKQILEVR